MLQWYGIVMGDCISSQDHCTIDIILRRKEWTDVIRNEHVQLGEGFHETLMQHFHREKIKYLYLSLRKIITS